MHSIECDVHSHSCSMQLTFEAVSVYTCMTLCKFVVVVSDMRDKLKEVHAVESVPTATSSACTY